MKNIKRHMEELRRQLNKLINNVAANKEDVLKLSCELDEAIIRYIAENNSDKPKK